MHIEDLIKTSLAIYVVARLVSRERGFLAVFARMRVLIIPKIIKYKLGMEIAKSMTCPYCFSTLCSLFLIPLSFVGYLYNIDFLRYLFDALATIAVIFIVISKVGYPDESDNEI